MDGIIDTITQFAAQEPAIFALIIGIIGAAVLSAVVNVGAMLVIWADRKVMSDFCNRFGPNRVGGRWGILQLGADAIKLFTKEDVIPAGVDKGVYVWAPIIASAGTMLVAAAIPFWSTAYRWQKLSPGSRQYGYQRFLCGSSSQHHVHCRLHGRVQLEQ